MGTRGKTAGTIIKFHNFLPLTQIASYVFNVYFKIFFMFLNVLALLISSTQNELIHLCTISKH